MSSTQQHSVYVKLTKNLHPSHWTPNVRTRLLSVAFAVLWMFGYAPRGVRVVASAHGDLLSLLRNPNLNAVLGGTTNVTVGDKAADKNRGNKV